MTKKKATVIGKPMVKDFEDKEVEQPKLEEAKDVGLICAVKGPVLMDGCEYLHPLDLARIELCRVKRELCSNKSTLVSKTERENFLLLQLKKQELRIAQLEYEARLRDLDLRKEDLKKENDVARQDYKALATDIEKTYNIASNTLTYDDQSGKLQSVD